MRALPVFLCASVVVLTSGCLSPVNTATGRLAHKNIKVELSDLDWLEIAYFPNRKKSEIPKPCRLSLGGTGHVTFKIGKSPQVWSDFAANSEDPEWNDIITETMYLPKNEMEQVFQAFVDEGAVPSKWSGFEKKSSLSTPYVKIIGTIGFEKFFRVSDNKYLVSLAEEAISNFEHLYSVRRTGEENPERIADDDKRP